MKILVCFKPLPCWERVLESDWESFSLEKNLAYAGTDFNCFDEAAFELALRLKEQAGQGATCAGVTVGGRPSAPQTESLYAAGFDDVIVLQDEAGDFSPGHVALRLSDFAQAGGYDLILTGIDSGAAGTGLVPFLLADRLGYPLLADVLELSLARGGLRGQQPGGAQGCESAGAIEGKGTQAGACGGSASICKTGACSLPPRNRQELRLSHVKIP